MNQMDRADGRSLRTGFLRHAARRPEATAVVVRDKVCSYGALEQTARRWAGAVVNLLGRPAERVGVFAYRSEVAYTGTLAALFSGAAFVPLNPTFPTDRTASMLRLADLDAIIVDKMAVAQLAEVLPASAAGPALLIPELDAPEVAGFGGKVLDRGALEAAPPLDTLPPVVCEDIAYLLFTSGSTGTPKGVPVTHGNALHFLDVVGARYGITEQDRFSQTFDQTFDLSVFDQFLAWNHGASIYSMATVDLLAPTNYINKNGITVWFSVPSVPAQMRRRGSLKPGSLPGLRWSLFCGEPLPRASAEAWQAAAPQSVVENLYGPTELTIACFVHRWDPQASPALCVNETVAIGRPLDGLGALVVDEGSKPVAEGEPGELLVSGPQTVPGYWRDPDRTAERFPWLAVSASEKRRFYRTGDRVRRLSNGEYAFLGRADFQIKVRGYRVELQEIEAVLLRDPRVGQAACLGWPMQEGSAWGVTAFVTGRELDVPALKAAAEASLPPYMVPDRIHVLGDMPLNANGKIDRNQLRARLESGQLPGA